MKKEKMAGFTLIELMIVVTIIGILASVAMPAYQDYVNRSKMAEAVSLSAFAKQKITDYHEHTGEFPSNNARAGLPPAEKIMGNYVSAVQVEQGAVHVTMGNKAGKTLDGKRITFRPLVVTGYPEVPFSWVCGFSSVPEGMNAVGQNQTDVGDAYLPASCRNLRAGQPPASSPE